MYRAIIYDLDGTVYRGEEPVEGAAEFVLRQKKRGIRALFATNRSNRYPATVADHLGRFGIECSADDVVTSAQATAAYLDGGRVYCIGEEALQVELEASGCVITDENVDHVIVSYDRSVNYEKLKIASNLIMKGATFIATNPDKGLTTEDGVYPGTGAIVAAVKTVVDCEPVMIGKPERLLVEMSLQRLNLAPDEVLMLGDNIETDIPAGNRAGVDSALILTGISTREDLAASAHTPTYVADDYPHLEQLLHPV